MRLFRVLMGALLVAGIAMGVMPSAPGQAATGTIGISPISGPPGTGVTVSGSGFTAGSSFTVFFSGQVVVTGTVAGGGGLPPGFFTIPTLPRGSYAVTASTSAGDNSNSETFSIVPQITLDFGTGRVGDALKVSGTGFAASTSISIIFDSTPLTSATSDPTGSFTNTVVTIPPATPGKHNMTAHDGLAYAPQRDFVVLPRLTYTPNVQTVGSQITMTGSGFIANSPISFMINNVTVVASPAVTDASGSFSGATLTIPPLGMGTHVLAAQDAQANSATANLFIRPGVSLTPTSGSPGATVQIKGSGFTASVPVTITYNNVAMPTTPTPVQTDTGGSFTASFQVPTVPSGSYNVVASDGTNTATASFAIAAGASLSPTSGTVGTTVTVTGANFQASVPVIVTYDGTQVATAAVSPAGAFTATFRAPNSRGGGHIINLTEGTNTVSLTFVVTPAIAITPVSGTVESNVSVAGTGFTAARNITVTFDRTQVGVIASDPNGAFSGVLKVPTAPGGPHQISATDGTTTVNAGFTILSTASISPATGPVGRAITVSGAGFGAGRAVSLMFERAQVATGTSDANGSVSLSFAAPPAATGGHPVVLTDGVSSANLTFSITPTMSINPNAGVVGTNVAVTGTGFSASKAVTIKYDNTQVAQPNTDAGGTFVGAFRAPVSRGGNHVVSITDGVNTMSANFNMDLTPPPAPEPVQPAEAIKAPVMPQFNWSEVNDPSGVTYTLQIASDATFSNIVLEKKDLTTPGYTLAETEKLKATPKEKSYYWRAMAADAAGNEGPWSTPRSFYVGFVAGAWLTYVIFALIALAIGVFGFWLGRRTYGF